MKLPHQLSSIQPHARLYQLSDGRFQIVEVGDLAPLMIGFGYVLVERDLAQYLADLYSTGVEIIDAIIYEPWRNEELCTHQRLLIDRHLSSEMLRYDDPNPFADVRESELDTERFFLMDQQYVFVSRPLKERLEASRFEYLHFTEGLWGFAGNRPGKTSQCSERVRRLK